VGGARFDVKWMKMSDIGTFTRGKRFVRTDIVEDGVPCIHYGDMYTYYGLKADKAKTHLTPKKAQKMRFAKKNDVVIVGAGENKNDIGVGVAWLGEEDVAVHDACYIFSSDLYPQYVSHFLRTESYHKQIYPLVSEGKICSISAESIGRAIIPIPPLEEQQRIVSILDRFEALTADLQSGLPAEIEARRKQYEYYREQLLTFKRKTA
jgi:type I restriction enzyme S subunit